MEDKIILKFKTKNILNFYEIEPRRQRPFPHQGSWETPLKVSHFKADCI